jgi:hypothetical protein
MGEKLGRTQSLKEAYFVAMIVQHKIVVVKVFEKPLTPYAYKMNI